MARVRDDLVYDEDDYVPPRVRSAEACGQPDEAVRRGRHRRCSSSARSCSCTSCAAGSGPRFAQIESGRAGRTRSLAANQTGCAAAQRARAGRHVTGAR